MSIATAGTGPLRAIPVDPHASNAAPSNRWGRISPAAWLTHRSPALEVPNLMAAKSDDLYEDRFAAVFEAYLELGGIAREDAVANQLVFSSALGTHRLSRWIAERKVLSVHWNGVRWLPIFQFATRGAVPHRTLVTILREMSRSGDDMTAVEWFCRPNAWLDGCAPAAVLHGDGMSVLHAARAECFSF